jgi:hypothetical protein
MDYKCIFCGGSNIKVSLKRRPVQYLILQNFFYCYGCSGFSLWPALSAHQISKMYSTNYIGDVNDDEASIEFNDFSRFIDLKDFIEGQSALYENLTLLDYGCGADAQVLLLSRQLGIFPTGVELNEATRAKARLISSLPVLSPDDVILSSHKFDVIFLGDLIEHVYNPSEVLSSLKKLLSDRGSFFIQGPLEGAKTISNFMLGVKARLNNRTPSNFPPYHVSLASIESIKKLLHDSGLEVTILTIREPVWPAKPFGSKESLSTFSNFIFSASKLCDITLSKFIKNYGTRFYCVARAKQ